MTDLSLTIAPKSDQLNSDDLIGGPRTITITRVSADPSSAEQPISISFEGDGGKPYKPCKSMRRVLVNTWGKDGLAYAGRSMTIYRDPEVQFGGLKVGGIRISHMSHITSPVTMALTATRANRKPYTVRVLETPKAGDNDQAVAEAHAAAAKGTEAFRAWFRANPAKRDAVKPIMATLQAECQDADDAEQNDDPFGLPPIVDTADVLDQDLPTPEQRLAAEHAAREAAAAMEREAE